MIRLHPNRLTKGNPTPAIKIPVIGIPAIQAPITGKLTPLDHTVRQIQDPMTLRRITKGNRNPSRIKVTRRQTLLAPKR